MSDLRFQKLTPTSNVDLNAYEEGFEFIFSNDDIRNIAVSGPYSSGKSSLLESYKKKHPQKTFNHISLAHFTNENKDNEERKNEFIDAAEKLFKENGIVETTISSIVKEMDVAKGLFYYYFKSKDDVIEAISNKYNEAFNAMMQESVNKEDYTERLKQFVNNSVKSFRVLHEKLNGEDGADLSNLSVRSTLEAKNKAITDLTKLFDEGVQLGELTLDNTKYYANILISGIVELIDQGEASNDEIAFIIWDLIERAGKD